MAAIDDAIVAMQELANAQQRLIALQQDSAATRSKYDTLTTMINQAAADLVTFKRTAKAAVLAAL